MAQYDRVVLVVDHDGRTGTFELRNDLEPRAESRRNFLLGGRGGIVNEILNRLPISEDSTNSESRQGFYVDGGEGTRERTFTAQLVAGASGIGETLQMGDGSSDPDDPDDVSAWDATNAHPIAQWQVFDHWLSEAKTDSNSPATLHYGLHSDGSEIDSGVYDPIDVAVREWTLERGREESSTATVSITVVSAASFADATDALTNDER